MSDKFTDMYFSFDIEASGGYPGGYSMISLGMTACATWDGKTFIRMDQDAPENSWYALIKERGGRGWSRDAAAIHLINRQQLAIDGYHPTVAMKMLNDWVRRVADGKRPVAVAYPLGFDWSFLYDYFCTFVLPHENPFGFSGCLDIKTMYATKAKAQVINSTKRQMPKKLHSTRPHTHNALDDAKEQGDLFCNLFEWEGK